MRNFLPENEAGVSIKVFREVPCPVFEVIMRTTGVDSKILDG
jgi:hypothetical protein